MLKSLVHLYLLPLLTLSVAAFPQGSALRNCADGSAAETGCRDQQLAEQLKQQPQQPGMQGQCLNLPCWALGVPVVGGVLASVAGLHVIDVYRERPYKQRAQYTIKRLEEKWKYNKYSFAFECMEGCVKDSVSHSSLSFLLNQASVVASVVVSLVQVREDQCPSRSPSHMRRCPVAYRAVRVGCVATLGLAP
jgi:hypothetical protein